MRILDDFGLFDSRYEGQGWLSLKNHKRRPISFEVRQLTNSQVIVGLTTSSSVELGEGIGVTGWAVDPDWHVRIKGLQVVRWRQHTPGLSHGVANATDVTLTHPFGVPAGATEIEFTFANLVIPGWPQLGSPIVFDVPNHRVTLAPIPEYESNVQRLLRTSGILPTCLARVWRRPYGPVSSRLAMATMDDVSSGLSLCTGTKVSWTSYRIADRLIAHRSSVSKEFSATVHNLNWVLDIATAVPAYMKIRDRAFVREMIDYLTDVTAPGLFIETRSLTACTLLDALTNRYARRIGYEKYIDGPAWKKLRPLLVAAIQAESAKLGHTADLSKHVDSLRRYSFEQKLARLLKDKHIPYPNLQELINVRNELVHSGRFPHQNGFDSFKLLLWTSFAVLARLAGYRGNIDPI